MLSFLNIRWETLAAGKLEFKDTKPTYHHKCEAGNVFHHSIGDRLNYAKSVEEFKTHIIALIRQVWLASHDQKITPCIITAVSECLEAYKKTALPVGPVSQFYNFRLEGNSLPAWIILHSPSDSDDPSELQVDRRHSLLQLFLEEISLNERIRDELYYACARMGFNNFFKRVRVESLRQLEGLPPYPPLYVEDIEIGYGLRPSSTVESLKVVPVESGFRMTWHVPGMLQKLQTGSPVGIDFVAEGQVWGMYIQAPDGLIDKQWKLMVAPLEPSPINLKKKRVNVDFKVSYYGERTCFNGKWTELSFDFYSKCMSTVKLPKGSGSKKFESCWSIFSPMADGFHRCFDEDGSCYVILTLWSKVL